MVEPGSLTVTGPTGAVVGAKPEDELGAVSERAVPPGSDVEPMGCDGIGEDVSASELLSIVGSGNRRHGSAISGAQRGARVLPEETLNFGEKLK